MINKLLIRMHIIQSIITIVMLAIPSWYLSFLWQRYSAAQWSARCSSLVHTTSESYIRKLDHLSTKRAENWPINATEWINTPSHGNKFRGLLGAKNLLSWKQNIPPLRPKYKFKSFPLTKRNYFTFKITPEKNWKKKIFKNEKFQKNTHEEKKWFQKNDQKYVCMDRPIGLKKKV